MRTLSELAGSAHTVLTEYTDPTSGFAFHTYDRTPPRGNAPLLPEDILVANLLSLRLTASDVIPLFPEGCGAPQRLHEVLEEARRALCAVDTPFEAFESADQMQACLEPLAQANAATREVRGWTPVTVSKVLHRHAPHLVPIVDSRVHRFYGTRAGQEALLRERMWSDLRANRGWLEDVRTDFSTPDGRLLSILRAADILIWRAEA